jgi:hypothetical protein
LNSAQQLVVALVTEDLHRRKRDDEDPLFLDLVELFQDDETARAWLERLEVRSDLIASVVAEDEVEIEDFIAELLSFAVSALEMWALHTRDRTPEGLVRQIALQWAAREAHS